MDLSNKDLSHISPRALSHEEKHLKTLLSRLFPGLIHSLIELIDREHDALGDIVQRSRTAAQTFQMLLFAMLFNIPLSINLAENVCHEVLRPVLHALQAS